MAVPGQLEGSLNRAIAPRGRTAAQLSNQFSLTAAGYMSWRRHSLSLLSGSGFTLDQEARLFQSLCGPQPGQHWLDAGTSGGYYAGLLATAGAQVLACDLSPAMLKVAQRREHSPLIDWALLDAEDTQLPAASFDGVCIGATLNETGSARAMLTEAQRLLRPGGQLWIMYLARSGGPSQALLSRLGGLTFPDPAEVSGWLGDMWRSDLRRVREVVFERWIRLSKDGE